MPLSTRCFWAMVSQWGLRCSSRLLQRTMNPGRIRAIDDCAIAEKQKSGSDVPGSIRMVYAIIYSLFLGYGITVGTTIYGLMDANATSASTCSGLDVYGSEIVGDVAGHSDEDHDGHLLPFSVVHNGQENSVDSLPNQKSPIPSVHSLLVY
jgi:hypothetical protein